jgi:transmembrane sensor
MLKTKQDIDAEAIGWMIRLRGGTAADWEAFTVWLEADPAHLEAYEAAALVDEAAAGLAPAPAPSALPERQPAGRSAASGQGRRALLGVGIAASLAVAAGWTVWGADGGVRAVETGPGERRTVDLADGSRIMMNGDSRLLLDEDRPRFARLERGEALFRIVHDEARPFEVEAGGSLLRDMGTVFNVARDGHQLEVAVSEGAVLFNPAGEARNLSPGMALRKNGGDPSTLRRIDVAAVGAWRRGRLVYSAAPAKQIAADLSRNLGLDVGVTGAAAAQPFSGVILLEGSPQEVLGRTAALLGLDLTRSGSAWTLSKGRGAAR